MIAIINGEIITIDEIIKGKILVIQDDRVKEITDKIDLNMVEEVIDAGGGYIMPGLIDIHSDKIEQFIQPRPTSIMDFSYALKECEKEVLGAGITTMYHSLSLTKDDLFSSSKIRQKDNVNKIANIIKDIHDNEHLIRHRFHLRIEIDNLEGYDIAKEMMDKNLVHEISFMDHTPGQGQYKDLEIYKKTLRGYNKDVDVDKVINDAKMSKTLTYNQLKELAQIAHNKGIAVASHDDDCAEKLVINESLKVDISEFPITMSVAHMSKQKGFYTLGGAPNILLGGSHSGNMSAAEGILEDCLDLLCSDYYPPAMLESVFYMNKNHQIPLVEMVKKVTYNPAKAVHISDEYGSIEVGKKADLLIVRKTKSYPFMTHCFVDGVLVQKTTYRR